MANPKPSDLATYSVGAQSMGYIPIYMGCKVSAWPSWLRIWGWQETFTGLRGSGYNCKGIIS